jgi:hypothetical protein
MTTDKSEPRSGLILKVGASSVAILLAGHAAFVTYFNHIAQAEEHRKFGEEKPEALINLRADETGRLTSGPMPIDKAMHDLAARGRTEASPDIMPTVSRDISPLQGWSKMPAQVPAAMNAPDAAPAPTADAGEAGAAIVDGAVPMGTKPDRARSDGGPSSKPPAKHP